MCRGLPAPRPLRRIDTGTQRPFRGPRVTDARSCCLVVQHWPRACLGRSWHSRGPKISCARLTLRLTWFGKPRYQIWLRISTEVKSSAKIPPAAEAPRPPDAPRRYVDQLPEVRIGELYKAGKARTTVLTKRFPGSLETTVVATLVPLALEVDCSVEHLSSSGEAFMRGDVGHRHHEALGDDVTFRTMTSLSAKPSTAGVGPTSPSIDRPSPPSVAGMPLMTRRTRSSATARLVPSASLIRDGTSWFLGG